MKPTGKLSRPQSRSYRDFKRSCQEEGQPPRQKDADSLKKKLLQIRRLSPKGLTRETLAPRTERIDTTQDYRRRDELFLSLKGRRESLRAQLRSLGTRAMPDRYHQVLSELDPSTRIPSLEALSRTVRDAEAMIRRLTGPKRHEPFWVTP